MEFFFELLFAGFLSVILAYLLAKLFAADAADQSLRPPKQDAGEAQSSDPLRSEKCEDDKGFGVAEVKSVETSSLESPDEVKIDKLRGSIDEISAGSARIDDLEKDAAKLATEKEVDGSDPLKEETEGIESSDDEWEGIEQTELQKRFHQAAAYVDGEGGEFALPNFSDAEQMQLHGLRKVATEGPCYDPQPMALKVSARARWHAWQRLGNMNPDAAMEQYMSILSEKIPEWTVEKPKGVVEKHEESVTSLSEACVHDTCSSIPSLVNTETERIEECPSCSTEEINYASIGHTGQGLAKID